MATRQIRVVTPPQWEPVTLAEARLWCRIDDDLTDQDAVLMLLIGAMREYAENLTGRAFSTRTLELLMDEWPVQIGPRRTWDVPHVQAIELPYPPLQSVQSVSYVDGDGALQVLTGSPEDFQFDAYREPGLVAPLSGENWPAISSGVLNPIRIRYTCGYSSLSAVPRALKLWINARIATLYENREQLIVGAAVNELPRAYVDGVLDPLIVNTGIA